MLMESSDAGSISIPYTQGSMEMSAYLAELAKPGHGMLELSRPFQTGDLSRSLSRVNPDAHSYAF